MPNNKGTDVNTARAAWRKSSYSQANGNCLEVADGMGTTLPVRDSKDTSRSPLAFSSASWTAFIEAVKENDSQL